MEYRAPNSSSECKVEIALYYIIKDKLFKLLKMN